MGSYDRDFHAWAFEQADAVRRRSAGDLDWENIAEELEGLGRSQRSELRSRYEVLIAHLLKWIYQRERRSRSWTLTIDEQRDRLRDHVAANPSLAAIEADTFLKAYRSAVRWAAAETNRDPADFPAAPPFTREEALASDWMPSDPA